MKPKRQTGIAVVVSSEEEFNHVKDFLCINFWAKWLPVMTEIETAIVLKCNKNLSLSTGSTGAAEDLRELGIKTVPFSKNLIQHLI